MSAVRAFRFGAYEAFAVPAGGFRLDGGAMFGVVPKTLWGREQPADEKNRIALALRCLLLRGNGRTILVDAGIGDKEGEKFHEIYAVSPAPTIVQSLESELGIRASAVTDVILTHLHFDHAGGVTRAGSHGAEVAFPDANLFLQASHLNWARRPPERERASYLADNVEPIAASPRLRLLRGDEVVAPGVRVRLKQGHTTGFQIVEVSGGPRERLVYLSDLVPTVSHLKLPYVMAYDNQPLSTLEEKRELFGRAVLDRDTLLFEHDPRIIACRLGREGNRIVVQETIADPGSESAG